MVAKFAKYRKVRADGVATRGTSLEFGKVGLKAIVCGKITKKQIESARVVVNRACGKRGRFFIRKNVFFPVTRKPLEVRMGGGKGSVDFYVAAVKKGSILFEIDNVPLDVAVSALKKANYKLNIDCKIVFRRFVKLLG
ncbi:MAG: 50S ribosomal protein L16 [Alphaproteobacteria bacterium]|nr:50S ribosomal protein L16 [Rickettsiales bacterium]